MFWEDFRGYLQSQNKRTAAVKIRSVKWAGSDSNQRPPPCQGITPSRNVSNFGHRFESNPTHFNNQEFWDSFGDYLQTQNNRTTSNDRINYAKKYYYILLNNDPSEILSLSFHKRIHIMKALTALSKFTGNYHVWQDMINHYNLKWSSGDSLQLFHDMVNEKTSFSTMLDWVKSTISKLPEPYYNIILFNTLTGLRPSEACVSISLIQEQGCFEKYFNKEKSLLEHFAYPELFIRRTKKAYVSIVNDTIIKIAKKAYNKPSYNALKLVLRRRHLESHLYFARKIFATHLRNSGIEQEIIDILQGRSPKSVFARHYYRPDLNHQGKIIECINSLYSVLTSKYILDYH